MYVMFPTKMFSYNDESSFLDSFDAFIIYFVLGKLSNFHERNKVFCNLDMLDALLSLDNRKSRSKKRIVDALEDMESLGYIKIKQQGKNIQDSPLLQIELVEDFDESVSDQTKFSGFIKVPQELFDVVEGDSKLFKIFVYVSWRQNIDYAISFEEWSNVLGISVATAKRLMKDYEEQGKLFVVHGEFYRDEKGRTRQTMNKYKIPSFQQFQRVEIEEVTLKVEEAEFYEENEGIEINGQRLIF